MFYFNQSQPPWALFRGGGTLDKLGIPILKYILEKFRKFRYMDATNLNEERWTKLHIRWSELVQLINLDGTFFDDANISELIDIEKKIWSCVLDFKEADVEFPESMKTFKPYEKLYEEQLANQYRNISTADIEDWNAPLYELADRMRMRKDADEFDSYRNAYRWAVEHITINGQPIAGWNKLERAYEKAKDQGLIIE